MALSTVPDGVVEAAVRAAAAALDRATAVPRLCAYYDPAGGYAGATFFTAGPVLPAEFTTADLFAVTLLSVAPPGPRETRLFLDDGPVRDELTALLVALYADSDLAEADDKQLEAMVPLYEVVKRTLGTDRWVTASKLCARKRPRLYPIRDTQVRKLLGLLGDYQIDWQVLRALMRSPAVVKPLREATACCPRRGRAA